MKRAIPAATTPAAPPDPHPLATVHAARTGGIRDLLLQDVDLDNRQLVAGLIPAVHQVRGVGIGSSSSWSSRDQHVTGRLRARSGTLTR
ncbi:MAG: hypothetical protein ACRDUV_19065 [Pseudonocardiaceae bacterium]